ncbi:hypothetical protein KHP62_23130, partial [Rhodobacteraceae bacterium NNCM2]|nr:hypothetical protein [Coraliihabitans acroporae]
REHELLQERLSEHTFLEFRRNVARQHILVRDHVFDDGGNGVGVVPRPSHTHNRRKSWLIIDGGVILDLRPESALLPVDFREKLRGQH